MQLPRAPLTWHVFRIAARVALTFDSYDWRAERDRRIVERVLAAIPFGFVVALIVFASGAVVSFLFIDMHNPAADIAAARYAWAPVYLIALLMMVMRPLRTLQHVGATPLIVLCVLLAGASHLWSVDPALSLRRAIALMMSTCLGYALAAWLDWRKLTQAVSVAFLFLGILTIAIVLADPWRGQMQEVYPGAWRGPWVQKNDLGGMMAKGLIATLGAWALVPKRAWLWGPTALVCIFLVLMSTSKTALLVSLAAIGLFAWMAMYRALFPLRPLLAGALIGGALLLWGALSLFPAETLALIGKDPTFTGRTDIWRELGIAIRESWLLGYGYGAFWMDPLGPSYRIQSVLEWGVPSAHNGWVEIWLAAGVGLVALFALHLLVTLVAALRALHSQTREAYFALLFLLAYIAFSLSESAILQQNDLTWVLFVAISAKLMVGDSSGRRATDR